MLVLLEGCKFFVLQKNILKNMHTMKISNHAFTKERIVVEEKHGFVKFRGGMVLRIYFVAYSKIGIFLYYYSVVLIPFRKKLLGSV